MRMVTLTGPSRTIVVEPVERPEVLPAQPPDPAAPPAPERTPEPAAPPAPRREPDRAPA
jgi:hypothetical protein